MQPVASFGAYVRRHLWQYGANLFLMAGAVVLQMSIPLFLERFASLFAAGQLTASAALSLGAGIAVVALGMALLRTLSRIWLFGLGRRYEKGVRSLLFAQWTQLDTTYYQQEKIGDLVAHATNDLNLLREKANIGISQVTEAALIILAGVFLMGSTVHPWLTFCALLPLPFLAWLAYLYRRRTLAHSRRVQQAFGQLNVSVQRFLSGVSVIKAFVREDRERQHFHEANAENLQANQALIRTQASFHAWSSVVGGSSLLVAVLYGGYLTWQGQITLGDFVAFQAYLAFLIGPVESLGRVITLFQRARAAEERISRVLQRVPAVRDEQPLPVERLKGEIEVRNLHFAYPDGHQILSGISFTLPAGGMLGIVGRVGSGKSTLVRALLRMYPVPKGCIYYDGHEIHEIPLEVLRRDVAYVPQDSFLFSTTVEENINFDQVTHTQKEVAEAARRAHVHRTILSFPEEYQTLLGERGITLSGGQRQRVSMARALIKRAPILILDDALSAVDARTEERILGQLRQLRSQHTTIVIGHRVSSVREADLILVLDQGRVVEQGRHQELMQQNGLYARMFWRQVQEGEEHGE